MHHRRGLRRLLKGTDTHSTDELVAAIEHDWLTAPLSAARSAMLHYCVKLTRSPSLMNQPDVETLREVGFSDRDILDIVEVTAYYAYVNRIADALGVPTEAWITDGADST